MILYMVRACLFILLFVNNLQALQYAGRFGADSLISDDKLKEKAISSEIRIDSTKIDTTNNVMKNSADSYNFVSMSDFIYAGQRRYTIDGSPPLIDTKIKPINFAIFTGGLIAAFYAQHQLQLKTIWKDLGKFRFIEDGPYAMYVDKAGHVYGAYLTSYLLSETLMTTGLSWDAATAWGSALGLSYATYIEILDGFGKNWGFSPTDFYSDVAGAALFLGQHYLPFLQNFTPKFTYLPADWYGENKRKPSEMFNDDYSSHTLWMSVDVHNLLPRSMKDYWPSWLQLSFGYAARNLCDTLNPGAYDCDRSKSVPFRDGYWGSQRFIIALDYDLVELLPDGGNFWNWLRQSINYFKWPSPAVEFGPTTRFFLVYPFHF